MKRWIINFGGVLLIFLSFASFSFSAQSEPETEKEEKAVVMKDSILVIRGTGFNRLRVDEALSLITDMKSEIVDIEGFQLTRVAHNLSRRPGRSTIRRCLSFTIIDIPAEALGNRLTKMITDEVKKGAQICVLGGPFAFGKGGYPATPLEEILPVKSKNQWDIVRLDKPLAMKVSPQSSELSSLSWNSGPTVEYLHDVVLKEGAEVLIKIGDWPVLSRLRVGEGYTYAFTAVPFGTDKNGFWEWKDWPKFLSLLMKGK